MSGLGNIFIPNANAFNSDYTSSAMSWLKSKHGASRGGIVGTPIEYYYENGQSSGSSSPMATLGMQSAKAKTTNVNTAQGKVVASQIVDFYYGLKDYMPTISPNGNVARGFAAWFGKLLYLTDMALQAFYVRLFSIMDLHTYQPGQGSELQQWFQWGQELGLAICVIVLLFYIIGVILAYNTSGFQRMKDIMYDLLLASFFLGALPALTNDASKGAQSVAQAALGSGYGSKNDQPQTLANRIVQTNVYSVVHKVVQMKPGSAIPVGPNYNIHYQPYTYLYQPGKEGNWSDIRSAGETTTGTITGGSEYQQIPNNPIYSKQVSINLDGMTPNEQASWNGLNTSSRINQFFQQYGSDADVLSGDQLNQIYQTITGKNSPSDSSSSSSSSSSGKSSKKSSKKGSSKKSKTILPDRLEGKALNTITPSTHAESVKSRITDATKTNQKAHALWGLQNIGHGWWHNVVKELANAPDFGTHMKGALVKGSKSNKFWHNYAKHHNPLQFFGHYVGDEVSDRAHLMANWFSNGFHHPLKLMGHPLSYGMDHNSLVNPPDQMNVFEYGIHSTGRTANIQKLGSFGTFTKVLPFSDAYARFKVNWSDIYLGLGLLAAVFISFIAKLVGTFFKALVMYATAGIMIYKSINSPSKVKYYIRTFFQLYEMLIMDVVMIKMYFIGYQAVNSACSDILFNKVPVPVNNIVLGIIQAVCDIALFYTTLGGVDAISRLLGQPTGSADGWGKALMSLQLGGMALSTAAGAARMGAKAVGTVGTLGLGAVGGVAGKLAGAKGAGKIAGGLGNAAKGAHSGKGGGLRNAFRHMFGNTSKFQGPHKGKQQQKEADDGNNPNQNHTKSIDHSNSNNAPDTGQQGIKGEDPNNKSGSDDKHQGQDFGGNDGGSNNDSTPDNNRDSEGLNKDDGLAGYNGPNAGLVHKIRADADEGNDDGGYSNDSSTDSSGNIPATSTKLADNPENEIDSSDQSDQSDLDPHATSADQAMNQPVHNGVTSVSARNNGDGTTTFIPHHDGGNNGGGTRHNHPFGKPRHHRVQHALSHVQNAGNGVANAGSIAHSSKEGQQHSTSSYGENSIPNDADNDDSTPTDLGTSNDDSGSGIIPPTTGGGSTGTPTGGSHDVPPTTDDGSTDTDSGSTDSAPVDDDVDTTGGDLGNDVDIGNGGGTPPTTPPPTDDDVPPETPDNTIPPDDLNNNIPTDTDIPHESTSSDPHRFDGMNKEREEAQQARDNAMASTKSMNNRSHNGTYHNNQPDFRNM